MMTLTLFVLLRVHQETAITLPLGASGQGRDLSAVTGAAAAAGAVQSRQNIDYSPPSPRERGARAGVAGVSHMSDPQAGKQ